MAFFSTAYSLCNLGDHKGFLHISNDEDDSAILALGRNIAINYRLGDQKQLHSWSTIQKLSSRVIYNPSSSEYFAIFNDNYVKRWTKSDVNLEKISKIKLKDIGFDLILTEFSEDPIVLFTSGACCLFSYCQDKAHDPIQGFLPDNSRILEWKIGKIDNAVYLFLTAKVEEKFTFSYSVKLNSTFQPILSSVEKLQMKRPGQKLAGSCFIRKGGREGLVNLWSDGFIYVQPLPLKQEEIGRFIGTVRNLVLTAEVAMLAVSSHHVVLYGSDPSEEGAVLSIYNLDFGMVQASTSFKFLQKPPRVWAVHNRLLVCVGQRLVCVPYTLETESVKALVGTRPVSISESVETDIQPIVSTAGWEDGAEFTGLNDTPENLKEEMETLAGHGCSEAWICEKIISDQIEKQNVESLSWCLEHFVDIPEKLCARLIRLALAAPDSVFKPTKKRRSKGSENHSQSNGGTGAKHHNPISPPERASFLHKILNTHVTSSNLFAALRSELKLEDGLMLLNYMTYIGASDEYDFDRNTLNWSATIIDAFYQQLILTKNQEVCETLSEFVSVVDDRINYLNEVQKLLPLLQCLANKKNIFERPEGCRSYSIQKLDLYN